MPKSKPINQKCLVTGGAGFIGSNLCEELLGKGNEVFCLDNLITGSQKNISHLKANPHFHFILHDITEPLSKVLSSQFPVLSHIYHLASPASPPKYQKYAVETLLTNSLGTYQALEIGRRYRAKFLLASTSEVYGDPQIHPQVEKYFGNVNPVGPRACYDEGKRFAETITMEYYRKFNMDIRIIRIFNTYGPKMEKNDGRVVSNFINQAIRGKPLTIYSDGLQTRSFCYVTDMVRGLILAMEKGQSGEVYNLGNPQELTIREIAEIIKKLTRSKSSLVKQTKPIDDPTRRKPDITKATRDLGWTPRVNLTEGLVKTITYFNSLS